MKTPLILAAACLVAALTQAAPVRSGHWQISLTVRPAAQNPPQLGNTIYNPRYFDGDIYATSLSGPTYRCFGRWSSVTGQYLGGAIPSVNEHRMVGRLRGTGGVNYFLATGGDNGSGTLVSTFTRYDLDYTASNPMTVTSIDSQVAETFDWVDDNTMISTCYVSGQRKKLYLTDVTAEPLAVTRNITWNADGYVTTPVSTRIRNVRVGQVYSGYAYYGDAGNNSNPGFYAINLATGVSTLLGNLGTLTGGGSFGLWTVIERGGYLYVQTTDNGIQVYNMIDATTLGSLYTTYTKAELDAATGLSATDQYYGLDVSADGNKLLLGAPFGNAYQLQERVQVPVASGQWQLRGTVRPYADNSPQLPNSIYNPRYFDGDIYATQISTDNYRCFGHYNGNTRAFLGGSIPYVNEHRMLGRLRNSGGSTYLMGSGGIAGDGVTSVPSFTRYDSDLGATYQGEANSIDNQVVETFDWVDDNTMISTCYVSGQRKKLYLTDVTAEPFVLARNTTWNADGYVTTPVSTRIRNVRVGQLYSGYAYYGDAGNNSNPGFYAIDLATGVSTLLGNLGTLTGGGSFGLWTVIERGGYLYVQTTDNGIQVYNMIDATTLGSLYTTYTKAELDAATGIAADAQYYGLDVSADGKKLLLGAAFGSVYELEVAPWLSISRSGTDIILSWPATHTGMVVESTSDLSVGFASLAPQPAAVVVGDKHIAAIPANAATPTFFRLRK